MSKFLNKTMGNTAEDMAISFLRKKKYKIKTRNFTTKIGEIDIVAEYRGCIVFIEVKYRSSDMFGRPAEAVNYRKQLKIRRVAEQYILKNKCNLIPRFDVIQILGNEINHIEGCF